MNTQDVINQLNQLTIPKTPKQKIPSPLVLQSANREGLSETKTFEQYVEFKKKLGLYTDANLPDGTPNFDNLCAQQLIKLIFDAIRYDTKIQVNIDGSSAKGTISGVAGVIPVTGTFQILNLPNGGCVIS